MAILPGAQGHSHSGAPYRDDNLASLGDIAATKPGANHSTATRANPGADAAAPVDARAATAGGAHACTASDGEPDSVPEPE